MLLVTKGYSFYRDFFDITLHVHPIPTYRVYTLWWLPS